MPLLEQFSFSLPVLVIVHLPSPACPSPTAGKPAEASGLEAVVGMSTYGYTVFQLQLASSLSVLPPSAVFVRV